MICPFLGLKDDSQTSLAFPSNLNYCHHCKPIACVDLDYQKNCCLTKDYEVCPVFLQAPTTALPEYLRNVKPAKKKAFWKVVFVILALLALMFILGWNFHIHGALFSDPVFPETSPTTLSLSVSPTLPPVIITRSLEQLPALPASVTFTPSPLPIPSSTYVSRVTPITTRRPHVIDELIGVNYIFRIHRVQQGESIEKLASSNSTTVANVMEVNYKLQTPLWAGQLVIIPGNQMDTEKLAAHLNVDPAKLRYYNGLGTSEHFVIWDWIIVPREKVRRPHVIDELIGVNFIFKIHRVQQGESIEMLASSNGTTVASLTAVNYKLQTPLWAGQLVIIPGNQMDVSGLPQFEVYRVMENVTTEKLAAQLNVDPAKLRYFNGLGAIEEFVLGDWIIVPREKTK